MTTRSIPAFRAGLVRCGLAAAVALMWCAVGQAQTPTPADSADSAWTRKPPKVFGFVQMHYRHAFETGTDSVVDYGNFRVQRVRIGVKGDVFHWLSYDVEIDPRAPRIRGILRDAFIELKVIPRHDLRLGQQKTQFGYENRESSSNLFAVNRTEVSDNLSRGLTLRDIGIGLIGNLRVGPKGFRIEDAITIVNGAGLNVQADDTPRKNAWGRIGIRWLHDRSNFLARFGVSGGVGDFIEEGDDPIDPSDDFRIKFESLGADLELDHPQFFFSAEFVRGSNEDMSTGETDDPTGYYVNLVGKTAWQVGPIVRFDVLGDEFRRWTVGAYYRLPSEPLRVMVNYELRQLKDGVRGDDKLYVWTQVRF